jgi:hypothetical protein
VKNKQLMGYSADLFLFAVLKKDAPQDVIQTLQFMVSDLPESEKPANFALPNTSHFSLLRYGIGAQMQQFIGAQWSIRAHGSIRKAKPEIAAFLEWLRPFIDFGTLGSTGDLYAIVAHQDEPLPFFYYLDK